VNVLCTVPSCTHIQASSIEDAACRKQKVESKADAVLRFGIVYIKAAGGQQPQSVIRRSASMHPGVPGRQVTHHIRAHLPTFVQYSAKCYPARDGPSTLRHPTPSSAAEEGTPTPGGAQSPLPKTLAITVLFAFPTSNSHFPPSPHSERILCTLAYLRRLGPFRQYRHFEPLRTMGRKRQKGSKSGPASKPSSGKGTPRRQYAPARSRNGPKFEGMAPYPAPFSHHAY
jgi:hypothetical protein